eukprot:1161537-Pelagomonas_calceolata.AAC.6
MQWFDHAPCASFALVSNTRIISGSIEINLARSEGGHANVPLLLSFCALDTVLYCKSDQRTPGNVGMG